MPYHGAIGPKMLAEDTGEEHRLFALSTQVPCAEAGPPGNDANTGGSKNCHWSNELTVRFVAQNIISAVEHLSRSEQMAALR
jgi:hypothetical protein